VKSARIRLYSGNPLSGFTEAAQMTCSSVHDKNLPQPKQLILSLAQDKTGQRRVPERTGILSAARLLSIFMFTVPLRSICTSLTLDCRYLHVSPTLVLSEAGKWANSLMAGGRARNRNKIGEARPGLARRRETKPGHSAPTSHSHSFPRQSPNQGPGLLTEGGYLTSSRL
jgi:hypothetical protein